MDRRSFLRSCGAVAGLAGAGGLLGACGTGESTAGPPIPEGEPSLNVLIASFEALVGEDRRLAFSLTTHENVPVREAEAMVFVRSPDGAAQSGPYPTTFHPDASPHGVYLARVDLPDPEPTEVVAVVGDDHGVGALRVIEAAQSSLPTPGEPAIAAATPTTAEDLGVAEVCTREPDCGMHEVSLEDALAAGRPVALLFSTPAFCQLAICGPAVDALEELRTSEDWGEVAFIHVEIFSDEGQTPTEAVQTWGLQSEPWFFAIDADGQVSDRMDGPMIPGELRRALETL